MEQKTKPTFRSLTRTCLVLSLLAGVAGCESQGGYSDVEYYQRAMEAYYEGNLQGSVIELKNALQQNPDNGDARWLLGRAYTDLGEGAAAEKELRRASSLGRSTDEILPYLGLALLQQRQFQQVLDEIVHGDSMPDETVARIDTLRGWAYLGLRQPTEAEASFATALERNPEQLDALLGQVAIAQQRQDLEQAGRYLDQAVAKGPDNLRVILAQAALAFERGNPEASVEHFRRAEKIQPDALEVLLGLARSLIALQQYQQGVVLLDKVLKVASRHPDAHYLLALAAFQQQDYPLARNHAGQVLDALPEPHLHSLLIAGASHYALKEYEQANSLFQQLETLVPDSRQVGRLLAATQLALGQNEKAAHTLLAATDLADGDGSADDARLLVQLGSQLIRGGQLGAGKDLLQRVMVEAPQEVTIPDRVLLALAKLKEGQRQEGLEELQQLTREESGEAGPGLLIVLEHIKANELDQALEASLDLQEQLPRQPVGYLMTGLVHSLAGRIPEARQSFEQALDRDPANPDASLGLAAFDLQEGDSRQARQRLEASLEQHPDDPRLQRQLLALIDENQGPQAALEWLQALAGDNPRQLSVQILLGRRYLEASQPARALELADAALAHDPENFDLLEIQGLARQALGDLAAAQESFGRMVAARSDATRGHFRLGMLYRQTGRWEEVEGAMARVLQISPGERPARLEMARALLVLGRLEMAGTHLESLAAELPDHSQVAELRAQLALARHQPHEAVDLYRKALAGRQSTPLVIQLAEALQQADGSQAAQQALGDWLTRHPDDLQSRMALGNLHNRQGQWSQAEEQYKVVIDKVADNHLALNNLAWVQFRQGKLQEARIHAEQALEVSPQDGDIQDTLAMILLEEGHLQRAEELLRRAGEGNPDQPVYRLHLAQVLARQGEKSQALKVLADLEGRYPNFVASEPDFQDLLEQLEF